LFRRSSLPHAKTCRFGTAVVGLVLAFLSATTAPAGATETDDVYVSLYILGSFPQDRHPIFQGQELLGSRPSNSLGAGLKVGIFPVAAKRSLGIEIESYGHGGHISFPVTSGIGAGQVGRTDLAVINSMFNVVLRHPGDVFQPYVGVGIGLSQGLLTNPDIPGRADQDFEAARTLGHQFIAGVQASLSTRTFVFSEYKYFSANYHWSGLSLDFRAHYALAGVGIRF
jgi:opacity protein-like surface antigen